MDAMDHGIRLAKRFDASFIRLETGYRVDDSNFCLRAVIAKPLFEKKQHTLGRYQMQLMELIKQQTPLPIKHRVTEHLPRVLKARRNVGSTKVSGGVQFELLKREGCRRDSIPRLACLLLEAVMWKRSGRFMSTSHTVTGNS